MNSTLQDEKMLNDQYWEIFGDMITKVMFQLQRKVLHPGTNVFQLVCDKGLLSDLSNRIELGYLENLPVMHYSCYTSWWIHVKEL